NLVVGRGKQIDGGSEFVVWAGCGNCVRTHVRHLLNPSVRTYLVETRYASPRLQSIGMNHYAEVGRRARLTLHLGLERGSILGDQLVPVRRLLDFPEELDRAVGLEDV